MADRNVPIQKAQCLRCGHTWTPRQEYIWVCPKCKSPKWNVPVIPTRDRDDKVGA